MTVPDVGIAHPTIIEAQSTADPHRAFDDLVASHQRAVFNLCYRVLGDRCAAEDATQDTFAAAWRHCAEAPARSWLLHVAMNKCRDELRRRARHRAEDLSLLEDSDRCPASKEPAPEAVLLRTDLQLELQRALDRLPHDQRTTILLCDAQGRSYREIAEITGVREGTVKSRIFRARLRLRELLAHTEHGGRGQTPPSAGGLRRSPSIHRW